MQSHKANRRWVSKWLGIPAVVLVFALMLGASIGTGHTTPANAAGPKTALLNGDTTQSFTNSVEMQVAASQGYTVTVVNMGTWLSTTPAQFGAYDLLIIGDRCGSGQQQAAAANAAVWAPVVMGTAGGRTLAGNRVLIGTDPVLHGGTLTSRVLI